MAQLKATARQEQAPGRPTSRTTSGTPTEGNAEGVPPGKYLVDDAGRIRWLVDPGINGKLTPPRRRHGSPKVSVRRRPNCSP